MLRPPLDDYQRKAVNELATGKILCGAVGTGKSRVAAAYYVANESPKDVIVITTAKKRDSFDWEEEFVGWGIAREASFGGALTVDSWNNLAKYVGVKDAFFIFDEQRLVGSGTWTKAFLKIAKQNAWILLSATPGDTWLDYVPVFVANGFYKNRTEFLREHVIYNSYSKFPKIDRYVGVGRLVKYRHQLLVEMPYIRHTTRKFHNVLVEHDVDLLEKAVKNRWDVFQDEPMKDAASLFRVMRRIVNSDTSRLEAVRTLMTVHPRLIVFYNFDYELEQLRSLGLDGDRSTDQQTGRWEWGSLSTEQKPSQSKGEECVEPDQSFSQSTNSQTGDQAQSMSSGATCSTGEVSTKWKKESGSISAQPKIEISTGTSPYRNVGCAEPSRHLNTAPAEKSGSSLSQSPQEFQQIKSRSITDVSRNQTSSNVCEAETTSQIPNSDAGKVVVAEWNGHRHDAVPSAKNWVYLVQYTAGAEGWNCIDTDAMIFYSLTYSYRNFAQSQGRIDRRNTPFSELHYYILKSSAKIDAMIWQALKAKKNFNERQAEKAVQK